MYRRCACLRGARRALARSTCAKGAGGLPRLRAIANLSRYACCCWMCVLSSAVRTRLRGGKKWRSGRRQTDCMSSVCLCVVGEFANCICVLNTKGPVRASKWAFLLTVKRDTQKDKVKERTTKSAPNRSNAPRAGVEMMKTLTVNRLGRFQETTRYVGVERVERYVLLK